MYTPSHFKQEDLTAIREMMEQSGFVSLVTKTETGLTATQAPVLVDAGGEYGVLRGHIARANLQWKASSPEEEGLAIFVGPNGYISPQVVCVEARSMDAWCRHGITWLCTHTVR